MTKQPASAAIPATVAQTMPASDSQSLQAVARFLRAVRYHKTVMVLSLAGSCLLGGLYYLTTDREFQSTASLLVLQAGEDTFTTKMSGERVAKDLMATYRSMVTSNAVLEEAAAKLPSDARVDLQQVKRADWVGALKRNLTVRDLRGTNILEVAYRSKDPRAAAAVVDCVVSAYLDFMDGLHKGTASQILDILTKEKADLERRLQEKGRELIELRRHAGELVIRDGENGVNVVITRAMKLNDSMIEAHDTRLEREAQLAAVEQAIRENQDLHQHALRMMDAVGREVVLQRLGLSNSDIYTVSRMSQELLENQAKLQAELQIYGPNNRRVQETQQRIAIAEQYLQGRRQAERDQLLTLSRNELGPMLLDMARQQLQEAIAHESAIQASYEQEKMQAISLDGTMAQLEIIELDLTRLRGFYDVVLERLKDIDMGREGGMLRTAILSRPQVPNGPVWPRLRTVAMLSVFLGLCVGFGIVYVRDMLDDHFRSPEELRAQLGVPVLAIIGKLKALDAETGICAIHAHMQPTAAETEPFRTLRTALAFADGGVNRIVISSSEPGDGKTTVVANLAAVYSQSGKRTLLVDADMRRPGLTGLLDMRGQPGLSTVLREPGPVGEVAATVLRAQVLPNLDVLPSGPRPVNPTELLASERFSEFLAWAEANYDQILIDSPPALVSDTAIIGRLVDGVLMAVQPEKNRRKVVMRAAESFPAFGIRVLGVVVNRLRNESDNDYYSYGYGYGSGYGYGYGQDDEATTGATSLRRRSKSDEPELRHVA